MILGIDFDNTLVRYDAAFRRAALEWELIPPEVKSLESKASIRDYLRARDQEDQWTLLQGHVYGSRMAWAQAFPGASRCIRELLERGVSVFIISHKTRYPFLGPRLDLHEAASVWLDDSGFLSNCGLSPQAVFFEPSQEEKLARITGLACSHFIDDLPEILLHPGFPRTALPLLFAPEGSKPNPGLQTFGSWDEIARYLGDWHAGKDRAARA